MNVYIEHTAQMRTTRENNQKFYHNLQDHAFMIASKGDIYATESDDDTINSFAGDFFNWDAKEKGFDSIETEIEKSILFFSNDNDLMIDPLDCRKVVSIINKCEYRQYTIKLLLRSFLCYEFMKSDHSLYTELNSDILADISKQFNEYNVKDFIDYVDECMSNSDFDFIEERELED